MRFCSPRAISAVGMAAALCCQSGRGQAFNPAPSETSRSTTVQRLNLEDPHSRGILGLGAVIAVLDSGLNLSNAEFSGNSRIATGYNAVYGSGDITDTMGHGTHVTGIIAASANGQGMYGVAPLATIVPVKIFNGSLAYSSDIDRGLIHARNVGARVVNLSIGGTSPTGESALRVVTATGNMLIVVAAGNNSAANPVWPARYAAQPWASGNIIAVGAVDSSNRLWSLSNKAGDTANWYLVAPGTSIYSTYGSSYAYMTGTSMAAPAVSGAAGLLFGYWPYLKASQVAQILLNTADDLGAPGVDAVYGHGLLNVSRALAPVGSYTYKASNGAKVTILLNGKSVISTSPRISTPSAFSGLTTQVFDEYGRNYTSDEGAQLNTQTVMTADSLVGQTNYAVDAAESVLADGSRLLAWTGQTTRVDDTRNQPRWNHLPANSAASALSLRQADGRAYAFGTGGTANTALGLMNSRFGPALGAADHLVAHPLTGFAPNHRFAALSMPLGQGWSLTSSLINSSATDSASANIQLGELTKQAANYAVNLSYGAMAEHGLLGGYSNAALGLAQHTSTQGLTLSAAYAMSADWTVAGSYSMAHTGAPQASGILEGGTGIRSNGYAFGVVKANTWRTGDRWSFTLNAPLRAQSGNLVYSVVDHVDDDGEAVYAQHVVNLKGTARELVAETRYLLRLSDTASITAAAALRMHADHEASAPTQRVIALRYTLKF